MPYERLPARLRQLIPSERGQEIFRNTVNSQLDAGRSEAVAMASAWAALRRAGFERDNATGKWERVEKSRKETLEEKVREHNAEHGDKGRVTLSMLEQVYDRGVGAYRTNPSSVRPNVKSPEQWAMARVNVFLRAIRTGKFPSGKFDTDLLPSKHPLSTRKAQPTASSVHVPSADWERTRKEDTFRPPAGARAAARRAIRWKEKYGDKVRGGTQVGWTRAGQLARGENLSRETIARMASFFARHRGNEKVDPKFKDEPWRDNGHIMHLAWGGDAGDKWSQRIMERLQKGVNSGPLPFESAVSSNRIENPSDIFSTADNDFGPCLAVFSLKSDVPSVSKGAELLGTPFFCSDAGGDTESLLVMPLSKISVSVEPSSDIVWNEFDWNFGGDEIVCLSRDDTPSSEIIKQSLAANSDNSMRQFVLSAGLPDDYRFLTSNIFSKIAHMLNVSGSNTESVSASYLTNTSVSKNETRPISRLLSASLEKVFIPSDSIGRANARTPRAMLSHNTLIFYDAGDSAGSDFKKSGNGDTTHTFKVEVNDFLLLSLGDFAHVGYDTLGGVIGQLEKRQIDDDSFTEPAEAAVRSMDLGLEGEIHVHDRNGQAVYMPGEDHEEYLERIRELAGIEDDDEPVKEGLLERTISAIIATIMQHAPVSKSVEQAKVVKMDDEQRIVWGWASVVTEDGKAVVDTQGDVISPEEMEKMANSFMLDVRKAKAMHEGGQIGEVIHSMPLTNELMKAFDIYSDREGWLVAFKIYDDDVWAKVRNGEFQGLSIGGKAGSREAIE